MLCNLVCNLPSHESFLWAATAMIFWEKYLYFKLLLIDLAKVTGLFEASTS